MDRRTLTWAAAIGLALVLAAPARAVIVKLTPLQEFLDIPAFIVTAKVKTVDAKRPALVVEIDRHLKGKAPFARMAVNLRGDAVARKANDPTKILKRVAPRVRLVLFISRRGKEYSAFAYTNGTWFGIRGVEADGSVRWSFNHCEPFLRRTFKGTTEELTRTVVDVLAGKRKPPAVNPKEKPGLGPELPRGKEERQGAERNDSGGGGQTAPKMEASYSVIAAPPIGALLAMLAMLFPTVFGGWQRWLVLLCVLATNSTLYGLHYWFAPALVGSWWGTPPALWTAMTLVALAGVGWAWHRHLRRALAGEAAAQAGKWEVIVLCAISAIGLGVVGCAGLEKVSLLGQEWQPLVAFCVGIWAGTIYAVATRLRQRAVPAVATEVVVLTGVVFAATALAGLQPPRKTAVAGTVERGEGQAAVGEHPVRAPQRRWTFRLPERGSLQSSPVAAEGRVYIAAALGDVFHSSGALYCLDEETGKRIWEFSDGGKMKQVFSSPCTAGGRVYIGEGFHTDAACKLYCLKAETGEKLWDFETQSHTESTPVVAAGKVYFGAGDDGLYCLDAVTGKKQWQFPGFHIDASPAVKDGRVFAGSGVGDSFQTTAIFCLDAATGNQVWRSAIDLPAWGRPAVTRAHVYLGLGNGRLNESSDRPAGGVLCLRAADGEKIWSRKLPDGVMADLVADQGYLYFGCRNGEVDCLRRMDGETAWRRPLGNPVVNRTPLARCSCCGVSTSLYVAASGGALYCLAPGSGRVYWSLGLAADEQVAEVLASPAVSVRRAAGGGEVRRVFVATTLQSTGKTGELYCFEDMLGPTGME